MAEGVPGGIVELTLILCISLKGAKETIGVKVKIAAKRHAINSRQIRIISNFEILMLHNL